MSHSMLNRKVLSAQARAHAHPYGRPSQSSELRPPLASADQGHQETMPTASSDRTITTVAIPSYSSPPAPHAHDPDPRRSHADFVHREAHGMTTPYSTQAYPTVPLQTARQRAHSIKVAASAEAAAAAVEVAASEAAGTAAAASADNRRRSTVSLEDVLSGDDNAGNGPTVASPLPYPSAFFNLDAFSMGSGSALMAEQQFLSGNLTSQPPPSPFSVAIGAVSGEGGGGARSATTASSLARPGAPSSATRDPSSHDSSNRSASSSVSGAESQYTEAQGQRIPPASGYAFAGSGAKRPSPGVAATQTQAQQVLTSQAHAFPSVSSASDYAPCAAPPTHETSSLGTSSFYRLPTASELNLSAAAKSYQAQRAAYEYAPTSTAVTGANAEQVLSVPFFPEICYMTNPAGDIVSVEDAAWNDFMDKNNGHPFLPRVARCCFPQVMGRSLFEFLRDPKLARFTRHLLHMVSSGSQPRLTYHWFCDSPTVERKMVMSVSRLMGMNNQPLVLWSSKILWERDLPVPASYLALPANNDDPATTGAMPCCSYCKRVMVYLSDLSLTPELVASLMAGSPKGSPVLGASMAPSEPSSPVQATAETAGQGTSGDLPDYEPNGLVPIFGLRGKRGVQGKAPFSAGTTHVWLTPTQYSLAAISSPVSHVYHGVCEVCWGELVSFFGL